MIKKKKKMNRHLIKKRMQKMMMRKINLKKASKRVAVVLKGNKKGICEKNEDQQVL